MENEEEILLVGPCVGELFWEFGRFVPYVKYRIEKEKEKNPNIKIIVQTRRDRFDLYGFADRFIPIVDKYDNLPGNCFRALGMTKNDYEKITNQFRDLFNESYKIIDHIYPVWEPHCKRNVYSENEKIYSYETRKSNKKELMNFLGDKNKNLIVLAPRNRDGFKRNWPEENWRKLFSLIKNDSDLTEKYNFLIVGREGQYVKDSDSFFMDMNSIKMKHTISLIGLTIEAIRESYLVVGSQSGIPAMATILGKNVLEWGHEKSLHADELNVTGKAKNYFVDDPEYNISEQTIYQKLKNVLMDI